MVHLPDAPLPHALDAFMPAGDARPEGLASSLACEIHEHAVPPVVRDALDRLYGSMYASWRHLQLCEADRPLPHAWVARHHGEVVGALLFRIETSRVLVLTEMMSIGLALVEAFCRSVYDRYPQAEVIVLNAVDVIDWERRRPLRWPVQSYAFSEDYVIALPANVDAYRLSLGKSTRKTIKGYGNRVTRELPGLRWTCREAAGMSLLEQRCLVRTLQRYKVDGMQKRGKHAAIDRRDTARLLILARDCGMYGVASLDGRVVAGSLACRFGDHYVMLLSAADPALARFRLGFLACYWSICDCISQQAVACHLLWGRYDYKRQLQGQAKVLRRVQLYRSRLVMLLRPKSPARMMCQGALHYGRSVVRECARNVKRILGAALNGHS